MGYTADKRYGRQGGRWAGGQRVDQVLRQLDDMRSRGLADGTWPDGTPHGDTRCKVCGAEYRDHQPPCGYCGRPPEHHADGDIQAEIAGRRRMAIARQRAGVPLDDIDRQVLASEAAA